MYKCNPSHRERAGTLLLQRDPENHPRRRGTNPSRIGRGWIRRTNRSGRHLIRRSSWTSLRPGTIKRHRKPRGGRPPRRPRTRFTRIWVSSGPYSVTELIVAIILDVNSHTHTNPRASRFLKTGETSLRLRGYSDRATWWCLNSHPRGSIFYSTNRDQTLRVAHLTGLYKSGFSN